MSEQNECVFCRILSREIPADIVYEDENLIAFRDIQPQAPIHFLIVPKSHRYANIVELSADDQQLLAHMVACAGSLSEKFSNGQFRFIFNTGQEVGQTVFHVHAHILGGMLEENSLG